jgi:glycosyltransferase involved in cell wall biosynthesis
MKEVVTSAHAGALADRSIEVVPLGVDLDRFAFEGDPRRTRQALDLPVDRPILLCVRRLVPRMGLERLLDAMAEVRHARPDVLLLIAGSGFLADALAERIRQRGLEGQVRMLGYVSEAELPGLYRTADLCVMPSIALEGFGLSTIEALSCGTPVLGTRVGATPEVLEPISPDLLCREASVEALHERLLWWLDGRLSPELREACRQHAARYYSHRAVAAHLARVFAATLSDNSGRRAS